MSTDTFTAILEVLSGSKATLGLLLLILIANFMEIWMWGKTHRMQVAKLERERDRWQALALSTTTLAQVAMALGVTPSKPKEGD